MDDNSAPAPDSEATAIVSVLNKHGVRYVVIGAFAAIAQRAPIPPTRDIDLTPEATRENLARLAAALKELGARARTPAMPGGPRFGDDGASLRSAPVWHFVCPHGEFDISFRPAGFERGYTQLAARAHRMKVQSTEVLVADLDDVISSKEAAGRAKDLRVLPALYRHRAARRG
jgi:hypothetical protein